MAESEARDWVLVWVEDLHRRAGSKRFWEVEQELLIQPSDFIFYKILPALNIMMTADFLFLPKAAHLFIYLLLKPLSSKLLTSPSADKKNSYTA